MDEPAVAEVDPGVIDLSRLRARAGSAPEEDIARLQSRKGDPLGDRHLAAHRESRAALQRRLQRRAAWVRLELVDAPHEAGAVETAGGLDSERRLGILARAAPDVRVADEADGRLQDAR